MRTQPEEYRIEENGKKMFTITSKMEDEFYWWGSNCRALKMSVKETEDILEGWPASKEDIEDFWEGYHNG